MRPLLGRACRRRVDLGALFRGQRFLGAALGAIVVNYVKTYFTSWPLAPYWLFMLGGLFIAVTLLLPRGIVGTVKWGFDRRAAKSAAAEEGVDLDAASARAAE